MRRLHTNDMGGEFHYQSCRRISVFPLAAYRDYPAGYCRCSSRLHNGRNFGNSDLQSMCRKEKPTICAGHKRGLYDIKKKPGTFALLWIGVIYVFLHANQFALSSPYRVLF